MAPNREPAVTPCRIFRDGELVFIINDLGFYVAAGNQTERERRTVNPPSPPLVSLAVGHALDGNQGRLFWFRCDGVVTPHPQPPLPYYGF